MIASPPAVGLDIMQLTREEQRRLHAALNNCFVPLKIASFPGGGNVPVLVLFFLRMFCIGTFAKVNIAKMQNQGYKNEWKVRQSKESSNPKEDNVSGVIKKRGERWPTSCK